MQLPQSCLDAIHYISKTGCGRDVAAEKVGIADDTLRREFKKPKVKRVMKDISNHDENADLLRAKATRRVIMGDSEVQSRTRLEAAKDVIDRQEGKATQHIQQHSTHVETVRFVVDAAPPDSIEDMRWNAERRVWERVTKRAIENTPAERVVPPMNSDT